MAVDYAIINQTMGKMAHYLGNHNSIAVSVSGGSDSDIIVHIIATYFREMLPKIHFVFVNTGLEYQATKDHLNYLEQKYDIHIDRIRGMSVVTAVRRYGVPMQSKEYSRRVTDYCNETSLSKDWINASGVYANSNYTPSEREREAARAIKERGIKISSKCCDYSKKKPAHSYAKQINADLEITGERRAEGGIRALKHISCFEGGRDNRADKYMPLFFWSDEAKAYYKQAENIRYSDCYEVWGFKRTGCVGCPFNSKVGRELRTVKKYEPLLYRACLNVFGESYRLMDEFNLRRYKVFDDQIWFDDLFDEDDDDEQDDTNDWENDMVGEPPSDTEGW